VHAVYLLGIFCVLIVFYSGFLCAHFILLSNYVCFFYFAQDVHVLTSFSTGLICAQLIFTHDLCVLS